MSDYGFSVKVENLASAPMKEIEGGMASMAEHSKIATKEVSEHFELMGERMQETFKNLKSLLLTGLGITALFEGWEFIEKSKEAFEGLEKAVARVDTVLKSTNFAAGFTSTDIQDQAKELSSSIVQKRDEILDAQGMLLSFHDIKGPKFTETMKSVADFATFYKEDMTQAALQVGKAINDPLKGMTRLQRMGVAFSAEQKEQIKNYVKQGELAKAQEVILRELRTEFGGQAQAFALTDAGKIQVASKQWEELQFQIGEIISRVEISLIPAFTSVVTNIKNAFNSNVIQFFIEHIKDLVTWALRLLPIWVGYRAVMASVEIGTKLFAGAQALLAEATGAATVATEGEIAAMSALEGAIASTGIGALVVGIGLVIENLISMNNELDKSVDKLTNLSKTEQLANSNAEGYRELSNRFTTRGSLGKAAKSELLTDLIHKQEEIKKSLDESLRPSLAGTKRNLDQESAIKFLKQGKGESGVELSARYDEHGAKIDKLNDAYKAQSTQVEFAEHQFKNLGIAVKKLKDEGTTPLKYSDVGGGAKSDAINTSNLSGASGGLGQAREIKIYFQGPFQQNVGVKESKAEAEKAIEKLTEMISGFSDSTNSQ